MVVLYLTFLRNVQYCLPQWLYKFTLPPTVYKGSLFSTSSPTLVIACFFIYLYFWLCWVFIAACGLSLVAASRGYSSLQCAGFSLQWLLLLWSTGSRRTGFSSCGTRAQQLWLMGSRAQAQKLWRTGLVAPWHVGSSQTRARTRVPCIGRQILNH